MTQAAPDPQIQNIRAASVRDTETNEDSLGFQPYVTALARFLTNPRTEPPLTISIEGEWGSGKSSFMIQLETALVNLGGTDNKPIIVKFNPWKHEEQESLWSAFALQYIRQISEGGTWPSRFAGRANLFWQRFSWSSGWPDVLRIIAFGIFFIGIVVMIIWRMYQRRVS